MREFVVGGLYPEGLPMVAAEALTRGVDSSALRELAGCDGSDAREVQDLYLAAMEELGLEIPDADEVLWERVRVLAGRIADGSIAPYEGVLGIVRHGGGLGWPGELAVFDYLANLYAEFPAQRGELAGQIVSEARGLLAEGK
ncbi:hypothetical protein [Spirillospora sp. NPDC029432]|uniref:hypothetical protein n=1 Tax=Spirillospora sp. NPDC029432 TaxID=3154599 RepID=UPI003454BF8F